MTTAGPAQLFEARVRLGCGVCLLGNFFSPQLLFPGLLQGGCVACGVGAESAGRAGRGVPTNAKGSSSLRSCP